MKLRRRYLDARSVFVVATILTTVVYFAVGLSPARATDYEIGAVVEIPSIQLVSDVAKLNLTNDGLKTPDTIAGSYSQNKNKTLLIGHSTTVFENLNEVDLNAEIIYEGSAYKITEISMMRKEKIVMSEILRAEEKDTLVLMTCAGELLSGGDATHRLMVKAVRVE